jgi:hypothetical protein
MPSHTPAERAKNRPARDAQRRRNTAKVAKSAIKGQPPRSATAGLVVGPLLGPTRGAAAARTGRAMNARAARAIRAPRNSPPMSSLDNVGGISGR